LYILDVGFSSAGQLLTFMLVVTNALSLIKDCRFEPSVSKDDHHE